MVIVERKCRGSFTVEATVIVSVFCMMIAMVVMLGFYGHDCSVLKSTAGELAMKASLYRGRYVLPWIEEVDYEAMKKNASVDMTVIENMGYERLQKRLLCGKVQAIQISEGVLDKKIRVKISVDFDIWTYEFSKDVEAQSRIFESRELPRNDKDSGGAS